MNTYKYINFNKGLLDNCIDAVYVITLENSPRLPDVYNKLNHDTLFYNNVKMDYLNNSISANNLDVIFTKKISKIYNNVIVNNSMLNLSTDKIMLDMATGNLKLEMENDKEKIKLVTNYELIN